MTAPERFSCVLCSLEPWSPVCIDKRWSPYLRKKSNNCFFFFQVFFWCFGFANIIMYAHSETISFVDEKVLVWMGLSFFQWLGIVLKLFMIRFYRKNNIKYVQGYGIDIKKYFFAIILTPKSNDKFRIIFFWKEKQM